MAVADFLMTGARVLYAATGTSLPSETTVAFGGTWPSFTDLGTLGDELRIIYRPVFTSISPQNALGKTKAFRTDEGLTAESSLLDFTGPNLALLMGGTNTTTAAGVSQKPFYSVTGGGQPVVTTKLWGFEGWRADANGTQQPTRIFIYTGSIRMNGPVRFNKAREILQPFLIEAYHDTTRGTGDQLWRVQVVTGPTS